LEQHEVAVSSSPEHKGFKYSPVMQAPEPKSKLVQFY